MDSNIIKILQKNEFYFCKNWASTFLDIDNKFFTFYNKDLSDDYFINRTIINKNINFNFNYNYELDKVMHTLLKISKNNKINSYLHINSEQILLEEYLMKQNFEKIDEVIGLQYPNYFDLNSFNSDSTSSTDQSNNSQKIIIVKNIDLLKEWIKVYCLSFDLSPNKKYSVYKILKKKFNIFNFILSDIKVIDETSENPAGCCILFCYKNCIALYCLGTKKEYRHKNVATNIIDFSIKFGRKQGYHFFGLQTLQSDNLLSFYERKGFVKIYHNKVYGINNR